jgi:hypothetical protein
VNVLGHLLFEILFLAMIVKGTMGTGILEDVVDN